MSHRIVMDDFKYNCNKKSIEADYNSAARVAGRMEGSSGLGSPIKWNDLATPCENREAAEDWINKHDRGNYDQIAVTYYDIDPHKLSSAKLRSLEEREKKEYSKMNALANPIYAKTHSAAFIGCKHCGSKLNSEFVSTNKCPLCGNDLRPESLLDKIKQQKAKIRELQLEGNKERDKLWKKAMKKKETCVRWMIKVEWHE